MDMSNMPATFADYRKDAHKTAEVRAATISDLFEQWLAKEA